MNIPNFETEEFYAKYEFSKPHLISVSDCESVSVGELIRMGGGSLYEFSEIKLGYPEMPGSEGLRREIASLYRSVNPDQVLVLGSPVEGIYLALSAILDRGDHVIVLSPAYDALFNVAEHVTGNAGRWFLKNDGISWRLDFEALEKLITRDTKLLVLNFPNNPTGFLPSEEDLGRILEITKRNDIRIFTDEIYRGLQHDGKELPSVADLMEDAIVLGGASKSLGLPGLRFGWLVTKDPYAYKALLNYKTYTSMCSTQAGEYLGRMALRAASQLLEKNRLIVRQNLLVAERFFAKWKDRFQWLRPLGGSVSLMKLNEESAERFCHELADRFGVVLLPARFMGYQDKYARLGFGRTTFESGMNAFDAALRKGG